MIPLQFICLMSISCNECRGDFQPVPEKIGVANHPGMAYLFDKIGGLKRSLQHARRPHERPGLF